MPIGAATLITSVQKRKGFEEKREGTGEYRLATDEISLIFLQS